MNLKKLVNFMFLSIALSLTLPFSVRADDNLFEWFRPSLKGDERILYKTIKKDIKNIPNIIERELNMGEIASIGSTKQQVTDNYNRIESDILRFYKAKIFSYTTAYRLAKQMDTSLDSLPNYEHNVRVIDAYYTDRRGVTQPRQWHTETQSYKIFNANEISKLKFEHYDQLIPGSSLSCAAQTASIVK
ncbi:MAG: hypothetical protein JWQ35_464 [Bacteriovoracaceae bacterium]|nr:hypothetical protein [Bacteriovoracaceae bacterium]